MSRLSLHIVSAVLNERSARFSLSALDPWVFRSVGSLSSREPREGPDWLIHLSKYLRATNFHKEVDFVVCHL